MPRLIFVIPSKQDVYMKSVGIFGYPISHSISPIFQQAAFDYLGIDAIYKPWCVEPGSLEKRIAQLRDKNSLGCNITIPHKVVAKQYVDKLDPLAEKIGSINTIVNRDEELIGYNTDIGGFIRSLSAYGKFDPSGKHVLVIGAGGAARAAVYGLESKGASSIHIVNRTIAKAKAIADEFPEDHVVAESYENINHLISRNDFSLIVNCSSMGMKDGVAEFLSPVDFKEVSEDVFIYDMVYTPQITPFLRSAKKNGNRYLGGLSMLVMQGAESFELWTGKPAPIDVMFSASEKAVYSR